VNPPFSDSLDELFAKIFDRASAKYRLSEDGLSLLRIAFPEALDDDRRR
jgi:hypothetical protein